MFIIRDRSQSMLLWKPHDETKHCSMYFRTDIYFIYLLFSYQLKTTFAYNTETQPSHNQFRLSRDVYCSVFCRYWCVSPFDKLTEFLWFPLFGSLSPAVSLAFPAPPRGTKPTCPISVSLKKAPLGHHCYTIMNHRSTEPSNQQYQTSASSSLSGEGLQIILWLTCCTMESEATAQVWPKLKNFSATIDTYLYDRALAEYLFLVISLVA